MSLATFRRRASGQYSCRDLVRAAVPEALRTGAVLATITYFVFAVGAGPPIAVVTRMLIAGVAGFGLHLGVLVAGLMAVRQYRNAGRWSGRRDTA